MNIINIIIIYCLNDADAKYAKYASGKANMIDENSNRCVG